MSQSNVRTPLFVLISLFLLSLSIISVSTAQDAQGDDMETRGAFFSTRKPPKSGGSRQPGPPNKEGNKAIGRVNPDAIGLGYTLYMHDKESGNALRVDPSREFKSGDRIRILLEANKNGFLYVFNAEESGRTRMIFPHPELNGGANKITAHALYGVPPSREDDGSLQWFRFDKNPGKERLYVVVTRQPLVGVPTGGALVRYCQANKGSCPWHPTLAIWKRITAGAKAPVMVSKAEDYGQAESPEEKDSTTRGLELDQGAPAPSVVRMSASAKGGMLVTVIDLIHK
jgi:hypothetical protein